MKEILLLCYVFLSLGFCADAQQNRFNKDLDKFCKLSITGFEKLSAGRKDMLNDLADQLTGKTNILFTCKTNSRRTLLLQAWAQTAFYYYGLYGWYSFSIGDTVTDVYEGVAYVLGKSGFYCGNLKSVEMNSYFVSIRKDYPENILLSKDDVGKIDTTKVLVVNICFGDEPRSRASNIAQVSLPYKSPTVFEHSLREKQKYMELNRQIATEMLYLGSKLKERIRREEPKMY